MKRSRSYPTVIRHWYRPIEHECPQCHISRREILYLFEAYCTLLRASSDTKQDQAWLAQVEKNGGIIVSVDGIQPDKGNETIYLVRDALTGRVLMAEQVTSSETAVMRVLVGSRGKLEGDHSGNYYRCEGANYKPSSNCGPMCHIRSVSSMPCAKRPDPHLRRIGL